MSNMLRRVIFVKFGSALQKILGHAGISRTMELYVHVMDDEKEKEMQKFERMCI